MGTVQQGAKQAINVCLGLKKNEILTIITDKKTLEVSNFFKKEAEKIVPKENINLFILENYGKRPLQKIPKEIKQALKKSDVAMFAFKKIEDEPVVRQIRLFCFNKIRYAHMPGITKEVLKTGLAINQKKIWKISKKVFDVLKNTKKIKVTSAAGTNITAIFNPKKILWINSDSNFTKLPQTGSNLPGAEVFTCPIKVEGTFVIDGELGTHFTKKYGSLEKTPLNWKIKDSRVTEVSCENKYLENEFKEYIKKDENANRIGEFAIGTNIFIKDLIGVYLQDEKFPSVHLAVGNPYPERTKADWGSKIHCDGITKNATVIADNKIIMKDGKYTIL